MGRSNSRNIVLLSDGTGNSSVSPTKSNVWRVYQALDLGPHADGDYKQIAFYDDGVGTSGFRPLMLLGGAFGWGLSRNVRQLYENLCRHYQCGDRIYIFGFSRGAFTARVLAHFISTCGILDRSKPAPNGGDLGMDADRGLKKGVKQAYKSYRRGYWDKASALLKLWSKIFRPIRDTVWGTVLPRDQFREKFSHAKPGTGEKLIEFIGVWDTVDAVGMPIDELSILLDKGLYPYKFPDQKFSGDVALGCHALAIDDERQTFHPLLWDERVSDEPGVGNPSRIKQVWFTGMHSNVGGSYPEDNLAYIALDWMIDEAKASNGGQGLSFNAEDLTAIKQKAQPLGKMYDSRRGAAVYYRYKPRNIADLSGHGESGADRKNARNLQVYVERPKVHHSVLDRIIDSKVGYAPTGLPKVFDVIGEDGKPANIIEGCGYFESSRALDTRATMHERAKDHIFWRHFVYFVLLFITLGLVLLPHYLPAIPGLVIDKLPYTIYDWAFRQFSSFIPGFAAYWTEAWTQSAIWFSILLAGLVGFFVWMGWIKSNTQRIAEAGWWHLKRHPEENNYRADPMFFEALANKARRNAIGKGLRRFFVTLVLPVGFTLICLYLALAGGYRLLVHNPYVKDGVCALPGEVTTNKVALSSPETFDSKYPCFDTGIKIVAGTIYDVKVSKTPDWPKSTLWSRALDPFCWGDHDNSAWTDGTVPATFKGLICFWQRFNPLYLARLPARRNLSIPWYTLTGEIGRDSGNVFPLNRPEFRFKAKASGMLYLYVNDAISVPMFGPSSDMEDAWKAYYNSNHGTANVTVSVAK